MRIPVKASVVIPTFNRKQALLRNLASLSRDLEVIVVDDGSSDGTEEAVTQVAHPRLIYIRQHNKGPASARNVGVEAASGEFVAFTDDDCIPVELWPWPLVARLEQEGPALAGVGGQVQPLYDGLLARYYAFHRILEPPPSCSYITTANCAYRREVRLGVGGFDDGIKHPGGEDPGLSMRVRAKRYRLAFEPKAVVLHEYRESLKNFVRTFYRYGKGCAYVMGKRTSAPATVT
jgi:glycosyltransferase involved in cell wall biosynthesis